MISERVEHYVGMDAALLDAAVRDLEVQRRRVEAELAAALAVIEQRQQFRDDGHRSMSAFVKATLNCGGAEANRLVRRARMFNTVPATGDAHLAGFIGTAQVDRLGKAAAHRRAGHRFEEFSPLLLDHAEHLSFNDFDRVVEHFEVQADTDGAFDDQKFQEDQRNATVVTVGPAIDVRAHGGSPIQAAEIDAIFKQAVADEFANDCEARRAEHGDDALDHPLTRSASQRRFDALHAIFMPSVTAPDDGVTPEPLVNIVFSAGLAAATLADHGLVSDDDDIGGSLAAEQVDDLLDRRCHTSTGVPLHPDVALKAMIAGHVRRVVVDSADVVINLGRTRRLFTGKARQAAQVLATTCSHSGCDIPAEFCDVDQFDEWVADNGTTDQANAGPACGVHDRWKHEHRIRARRGANGRVYLIRPDGTVIKPAGARDPRWADDARPSAPGHTVTWAEFIEQRPQPETGWAIERIDFSELQSR